MTGSNAYAVFDVSSRLKARHDDKECVRVEIRKLKLANQAALLVLSSTQTATVARQVLRSGGRIVSESRATLKYCVHCSTMTRSIPIQL